MNDRFRFRVWNEKERKFILDHNHPIGSDYFLALDTEGKLLKIGMGDLNEEKQCSWGNVEEYQGIVEQCTGLKDKNGRLIYEGDIVCWTRAQTDGDVDSICSIVFDNDMCSFGPLLNGHSLWMPHQTDLRMKVVGNIHENPELLER